MEHPLFDYDSSSLGYGNTQAPIWFVGPEEAGSHTEERAVVWRSLGSRPLSDMREFHLALADHLENSGAAKDAKKLRNLFYAKLPPLQPTWKRLAQMALQVTDYGPERREDLKRFQRDHLGTESGSTAVIETRYGQSPKLRSSRSLDDTLMKARKVALQNLFTRAPEDALFVVYGETAAEELAHALGFEELSEAKLLTRVVWDGRMFVRVPHPVARSTNAKWNEDTSELWNIAGNRFS